MMISRRSILAGLIAAPIVVRPGLLMPVRPIITEPDVMIGIHATGPRIAMIGWDRYGETVSVKFMCQDKSGGPDHLEDQKMTVAEFNRRGYAGMRIPETAWPWGDVARFPIPILVEA